MKADRKGIRPVALPWPALLLPALAYLPVVLWGTFNFDDVARDINDKLIRRHYAHASW